MSVLGFMAAALVMAGFAVRTLITASRPNELWADLDEVLAEILQGTDSALPAE
jgi:hypothetical protein